MFDHSFDGTCWTQQKLFQKLFGIQFLYVGVALLPAPTRILKHLGIWVSFHIILMLRFPWYHWDVPTIAILPKCFWNKVPVLALNFHRGIFWWKGYHTKSSDLGFLSHYSGAMVCPSGLPPFDYSISTLFADVRSAGKSRFIKTKLIVKP